VDLLITKTIGFLLVLTRLSAFFVCLPVFSWRSIPGVVRISLGFWIAIFFASELKMPFDAGSIKPLQAMLMMTTEAMYGGAIGLTVAMVFWAVRVGGSIADQQMGYSMAEVLDPISGEQTDMIALVLEVLFLLLFLSVNGHHMLLVILQKSYHVLPIGSAPDIGMLTNMVVQAGSVMLLSALKLAAPILALFMVLMVVLGVLARVLPDMNMLFESMPVRVAIGLISLTIFLPLMLDYMKEFTMWMDQLMPFLRQ
jgi:flagellar biosynthesis protein FliR